ncbi:4-hydroxybutyrate coenzyme A transferase [Adelges cooleyi]|uniref:4-hydroxybutyrate coenzyme A transferase n=1 Tax=Adelges cooleyi TaxID=133065 RepID=UPI00217F3175|nr:4-hydroxybutyrate coenzyme A transferase [Adelges cooleyi]XP_050437074.1 4-hydroxybutyrate coenzyme A transferase [Adelges cooleyi]
MASAINRIGFRFTVGNQGSKKIWSTIVRNGTNSKSYFTYTPQVSQILDREPKWVSADEAVQCIKSGDTVFVGGAASTPIEVLRSMTDHGKQKQLKNVRVCSMHTEFESPYSEPECADIFRPTAFFISANLRKCINEGRGDAIPLFLHDIPYLFERKLIPVDVSIITVSPPDHHGFCSLGTSVDCIRSALSHSKVIIAQVNKHMPRTFGEAIIHQSHIDFAVKHDRELPVHGDKAPTATESAIGKHIADNLVEDGATLQMGIGAIPDATLSCLKDHKDLGIHSEMFSIGVIDLVRSGVITNHNKKLDRGLIVTSFLMGNQKLYDFVDNNPLICMRQVSYTNNVHIISQQPKMTAINSCIEVDLTGQIVSGSIGYRMYSGYGGQVDFIRGAAEGFDGKGKPIIALGSVNPKTKDERGVPTSKIVPIIKEGATVVTTSAHAHYVVTEFGVASLFGKSLRQRAHALINVAHPDHREWLEKASFDRLKVMPSA